MFELNTSQEGGIHVRCTVCVVCRKGRNDLATDERLEEVRFGVAQLLPAHFHTLKYLMSHLHRYLPLHIPAFPVMKYIFGKQFI